MKTTMIILGMAMAASCPAGSERVDPFIKAIENMKHSVAPVDCLAVNGADSKILDRMGTAFFISEAGDFLTAAHVLLAMKGEKPCPISAVIMPVENWDPEALDENQVWFPFRISDCRIDKDLDVARCSLIDDLSSKPGRGFKIVPIKHELRIPPDGTQLAFTGFPLRFRDPMTSRAGVAAYRKVWRNEKPVCELVLDRAAWPGSSGSPVYLSDGSVVGILVAGGTEEATGMTLVRPVSLIPEMFAEKPKR